MYKTDEQTTGGGIVPALYLISKLFKAKLIMMISTCRFVQEVTKERSGEGQSIAVTDAKVLLLLSASFQRRINYKPSAINDG